MAIPSGTKRTAATGSVILALALEVVSVGLLSILAGASDEIGSFVILFMVALWILFLITHTGIQTSLNNWYANVSAQTGLNK